MKFHNKNRVKSDTTDGDNSEEHSIELSHASYAAQINQLPRIQQSKSNIQTKGNIDIAQQEEDDEIQQQQMQQYRQRQLEQREQEKVQNDAQERKQKKNKDNSGRNLALTSVLATMGIPTAAVGLPMGFELLEGSDLTEVLVGFNEKSHEIIQYIFNFFA